MAHCPHTNRDAVLRNPKSGLVLDASQGEVKLQHFTGFPAQLWSLESCEPGKFIIVNKGNGKVMDIQGGVKSGSSVITYSKHGAVNQQWYVNSDHTIVSAGGNLAVDICQGNYNAGARIIAFPKHGGPNQQFNLQYQ